MIEQISVNGALHDICAAYGNVTYGVTATSHSSNTSLSLDGTTPLHIVSMTANISGLSLSANPSAGHSCHVMFVNESSADKTVQIAFDNTNRITPDGSAVELTVPKSSAGYVEVDFLNVNGKIFVRGV